MADHLRKQVRSAIKALIIAANTAAGTRVEAGRIYPLATDGPWPRVTIASFGEQIQAASMGGGLGQRQYQRTYRVNVVAHAKDLLDVESVLDDVGRAVEIAIAADATLGGTCVFFQLSATRTELSPEAEEPSGSLTMTYDVEMYSRENAPDALG